jgi:hypothetical protein
MKLGLTYISGTDPAREPTYRQLQSRKYTFTSLSGFNFPFGNICVFSQSRERTMQYQAYFQGLNPRLPPCDNGGVVGVAEQVEQTVLGGRQGVTRSKGCCGLVKGDGGDGSLWVNAGPLFPGYAWVGVG